MCFSRASRVQPICIPGPGAPPKHAAHIDSKSHSPAHDSIAHPESTHDRAHVSIITTCSDAWLNAGRLRTYTSKDRPGQRERRRAQPPTLPHAGRSASFEPHAEGMAAAQPLHRFRSRLAECSSQSALLLHSAAGIAQKCNAEAGREPSRRLSSFFRKSLDSPWTTVMFVSALAGARCRASKEWYGLYL